MFTMIAMMGIISCLKGTVVATLPYDVHSFSHGEKIHNVESYYLGFLFFDHAA